jgi:hypothetical protein
LRSSSSLSPMATRMTPPPTWRRVTSKYYEYDEDSRNLFSPRSSPLTCFTSTTARAATPRHTPPSWARAACRRPARDATHPRVVGTSSSCSKARRCPRHK